MWNFWQRPRLGLTLGGGGARGGAHIGVLKVLKEIGYKPDIVVGSSMGALVAAMVAAGMGPEEMEHLLCEASINVMDCSRNDGRGHTRSERLEFALSEHFGDADIRDFPIKLAVMATDLTQRARVMIQQGSVVKALLASIAIPGVFTPVEWNGRVLVDGGVLDNLPTQAAYVMGADRLVAVSLGGGREGVDEALDTLRSISQYYHRIAEWTLRVSGQRSTLETMYQSLSLSAQKLQEQYLRAYPPDVLLEPEMPKVSLLAMERMPQAIAAGETAARKARPALQDLVKNRSQRPKALNPLPALLTL